MKRVSVLLILLGAGALSSAAAAQQNQGALLDALRACRQVPDPAARLACYETASAAIEQAVSSEELVLLDREALKATRKSLFGFSLPKLPFFGKDDKSQEEDEITATIKSARSLGYGKWRIVLEDGAVWQTTEASRNANDPRAGQSVRIKRGVMGSYMINVAGQRGIRAKRDS